MRVYVSLIIYRLSMFFNRCKSHHQSHGPILHVQYTGIETKRRMWYPSLGRYTYVCRILLWELTPRKSAIENLYMFRMANAAYVLSSINKRSIGLHDLGLTWRSPPVATMYTRVYTRVHINIKTIDASTQWVRVLSTFGQRCLVGSWSNGELWYTRTWPSMAFSFLVTEYSNRESVPLLFVEYSGIFFYLKAVQKILRFPCVP